MVATVPTVRTAAGRRWGWRLRGRHLRRRGQRSLRAAFKGTPLRHLSVARAATAAMVATAAMAVTERAALRRASNTMPGQGGDGGGGGDAGAWGRWRSRRWRRHLPGGRQRALNSAFARQQRRRWRRSRHRRHRRRRRRWWPGWFGDFNVHQTISKHGQDGVSGDGGGGGNQGAIGIATTMRPQRLRRFVRRRRQRHCWQPAPPSSHPVHFSLTLAPFATTTTLWARSPPAPTSFVKCHHHAGGCAPFVRPPPYNR